MATVHGKLVGLDTDTEETTEEPGSVDIMLCGYGSRTPVSIVVGPNGTICDVELKGVKPDLPGNEFSVDLAGNDNIIPAGTYYTITTRNPNGDIVQCNAYVFLGDNDYDLTNTQPFDPTLPPSPLPPLIYNQLLIIPFTPTPNFPGDVFSTWGITLSGDVTASSLSGIMRGNLYTFIITQGAGGGWKFKWPTLVLNPDPVNQAPGANTIQTFVAIATGGPLLPVGPATYYP